MKKKIVVLSGLAGAGKSTAARALEDLGFFVVDNLPPPLIETLLQLSDVSGGERQKLAFVIDARETTFLKDFGPTWDRLRGLGHEMMLLFLDASDEVIVRRFQETRRRHPLDVSSEGGADNARAGVLDAIARERKMLADVSMRADAIVDTRDLNVHELKKLINERFGGEAAERLLVTVMSFGFKHGVPHELDLCFDVRFLPNPFFVEHLRPLSGKDPAVASFVLEQPDTQPFLARVEDLVAFLLPRFEGEGKSYVTIAVGCTGGRHRSPAIAAALGGRLAERGINVRVVHRDVDGGHG
jgi:RNase adapter protein RapZ